MWLTALCLHSGSPCQSLNSQLMLKQSHRSRGVYNLPQVLWSCLFYGQSCGLNGQPSPQWHRQAVDRVHGPMMLWMPKPKPKHLSFIDPVPLTIFSLCTFSFFFLNSVSSMKSDSDSTSLRKDVCGRNNLTYPQNYSRVQIQTLSKHKAILIY